MGLAGGKTHIVLKKTSMDLKTYRPISVSVDADWSCQPSPACKAQIGFANHILIFHDLISFCFCCLLSFPAVCDFKYKINSGVQLGWSKQLVSFFFIWYSLFAYFFLKAGKRTTLHPCIFFKSKAEARKPKQGKHFNFSWKAVIKTCDLWFSFFLKFYQKQINIIFLYNCHYKARTDQGGFEPPTPFQICRFSRPVL